MKHLRSNLANWLFLLFVFQFGIYLSSFGIAMAGGVAPSKCVPVQSGIWNCDLLTMSSELKKCGSAIPKMEHKTTWQSLASREEVYALLKKKYIQFGSAIDFANWLNCQGFNVTINANRDKQLISGLDINYFRKNIIPYYVPWYDPYSWIGGYDSEAFVLDINESGQIVKIETWKRL